MSEDQSPSTSRYNIPPEDWDHGRALTKYPPQIIFWMIRELFEELRRAGNADAALVGQLLPDLPHHESFLTAQISVSKTEGAGESENRWFCIFDEHSGISFRRRADWKRHMDAFHKPGKNIWQCPVKGCLQIFDQASNFRQHHRIEHRCRKSCKHADSAKTRARVKQAFACGRESCQTLLFSWDEWRDHVAEHMEEGMTPSQWQYNTLFRNLLRCPEIHPLWEQFVATKVHPFNISARFTWRPRNTLPLKMQLEYNDESDLLGNAATLVLQAYETGTAVRSTHELLDPSALITEQPVMPKRPSLDPDPVPQPDDTSSSVVGDSATSLHSLHRELQVYQASTPMLVPGTEDLLFTLADDQRLSFDQFQIGNPPFSDIVSTLTLPYG